MGFSGMIYGLVIRSDREGRHSSNFGRYFDKSWPFHVRNRAFGIIPTSIMCLLWGVASVIAEFGGPWLLVGGALGMLGLLIGLVGIALQYRPPDWLKSEWLREEERRRQEQC